jgi:uncharacterized phiE125 gp8 family phage protein
VTPAWTRLTWTTPSASIITVAELKSHLRVDFDDDDDLMSDLVVAAQAHIEGPEGIGLALAPSTWRLSLDGFPSDQVIAIPLGPVTAVTGITYLDASGAHQTLDLANVRIDLDGRPARITPALDKAWPETADLVGAVKVTFTAGPASPDPALKRAVLMLAAHWYAHPSATAPGQVPEIPLGVAAILARKGALLIG